MAATVITKELNGSLTGQSGSDDEYTYTNNTGGNVRAILYWANGGSGSGNSDLRWGDFSDQYLYTEVAFPSSAAWGRGVAGPATSANFPTELMLADGHKFQFQCNQNNTNLCFTVLIIPEGN